MILGAGGREAFKDTFLFAEFHGFQENNNFKDQAFVY